MVIKFGEWGPEITKTQASNFHTEINVVEGNRKRLGVESPNCAVCLPAHEETCPGYGGDLTYDAQAIEITAASASAKSMFVARYSAYS